jgi:hypothetical protein
MPFNTPAKNLMLEALDESLATGIDFIGIHQLTGTDPGTGTNATGTEATGGTPAYARMAVTWGAAAAEIKQNTNTITIDLPAGTYGFVTYWNANTGNTNNYLGYSPINGTVRGFFTVDTTLTNDQLLSPGHGLANGDRVMLFNAFGTALPTGTGLAEGAVLFVVNSAADTFKVSLTSGGAAIDLTAVGGGEGYFEKIIPEVFASQGQFTIAAAGLTLDLTGI